MSLDLLDMVKLLLAIVAGALIGAEREYRDKTAGFRTLIFICVGAALFTMFSIKIGGENDPRIASSVVSGIGFLGAGVILREKGRVVGLTTAAMIWLTAAIGMGIGSGYFLLSGVTVLFVLVILLVFPRFERIIDLARETRSYEIVCRLSSDKATDLQQLFQRNKLTIRSFKQEKSGDLMTCTVVVVGSLRNHDQARQRLLQDPEVQSFTF